MANMHVVSGAGQSLDLFKSDKLIDGNMCNINL
jgi:hypothetical protein